MSTPAPSPASDILDWLLEPHEIGDDGLASERSASAVECSALAAALDLLACRSLTASYRVRSTGRGRYRMEGRLKAKVTQACVVSLEPVAGEIDEAIDVRFAPAADVPATRDIDIEAEDPPEPLDPHGRIPLGRIVYEHLAAAIDPYPRLPGSELELSRTPAAESPSPFAALARLKPKQD